MRVELRVRSLLLLVVLVLLFCAVAARAQAWDDDDDDDDDGGGAAAWDEVEAGEDGVEDDVRGENELYALFEWLRGQGGIYDDVGVAVRRSGGAGRGLFAARDLEPGHAFLKVPLGAMMNVEHAMVSAELGHLAEQLPQWPDADVLGVFMYVEKEVKGVKSHWYPYLRTMPRAVGCPLRWLPVELQELEGSRWKRVIERVQSKMKEWHARVRSSLPVSMDLDEYALAVSWVHSRVHAVRVRDAEGMWHDTKSMVPLADLINMALTPEDSNVECLTAPSSRFFVCRTAKAVQENEELLGVYASSSKDTEMSNGELLLHYGFTLENNPYDDVEVVMEARNRTLVQSLLEPGRIDADGYLTFRLRRPGADAWPPSREVAIVARLQCLDASERNAAIVFGDDMGDVGSTRLSGEFLTYVQLQHHTGASASDAALLALFARTEECALGLVDDLLVELLSAYASPSTGEDEVILESVDLATFEPEYQPFIHAVRIRTAEKQIITAWLALLERLREEVSKNY